MPIMETDTRKLAICVREYWKAVDECLEQITDNIWKKALDIAKSLKPDSDEQLKNLFVDNYKNYSLVDSDINLNYTNRICQLRNAKKL